MTFFDEMLSGQGARPPYDAYAAWFETKTPLAYRPRRKKPKPFSGAVALHLTFTVSRMQKSG